MKFFLTAFLSSSLILSTQAFAGSVTIDQLKSQADAEYSQRDYSPAGVAHAQAALTKYNQLLTMTNDPIQLAQINLGIAKSIYFVGDNSTDKSAQKQLFLQGMSAADLVLKNYGINDTTTSTLTDALAQSLNAQNSANKVKMDILAEALYQKAANLAQWGNTDLVGALNRWPELRNLLDFITKLSYSSTDSTGKITLVSYKSLHEYASYRIVGRGLYVIPGLLGGDLTKSEKYLQLAFTSSQAVDASGKTLNFSTNGYNNLYYADTLIKNKKAPQAKAILTAFVAADPKDSKVFPDRDSVVDVIDAQRQARETLSKN